MGGERVGGERVMGATCTFGGGKRSCHVAKKAFLHCKSERCHWASRAGRAIARDGLLRESMLVRSYSWSYCCALSSFIGSSVVPGANFRMLTLSLQASMDIGPAGELCHYPSSGLRTYVPSREYVMRCVERALAI